MGYAAGLTAIGTGRANIDERNRMAQAVRSVPGGVNRRSDRRYPSMFDAPDTGLAGIGPADERGGSLSTVAGGGIDDRGQGMAMMEPDLPVGMNEESAQVALPMIQQVVASARKNLAKEKPTKKDIVKFNKDFFKSFYQAAENDADPNHPIATAVFNAGNMGGFKRAGSTKVVEIDGNEYYVPHGLDGKSLLNAFKIPVKRRLAEESKAGKAIREHYQKKAAEGLLGGEDIDVAASDTVLARLAEAKTQAGMSVNQAISEVDEAVDIIKRAGGEEITADELNNRLIGLAEQAEQGTKERYALGDSAHQGGPARGGISIGAFEDRPALAVTFGKEHPLTAALEQTKKAGGGSPVSAKIGINGPEQPGQETAPPPVGQESVQELPVPPAPAGQGTSQGATQAAASTTLPRAPVPEPRPAERSFSERNPRLAAGLASVGEDIQSGLSAAGDYVGGKFDDAAQRREDFATFQERWEANDIQPEEFDQYIALGVSLLDYIEDPQQRQFILEQAQRLRLLDGVQGGLGDAMMAGDTAQQVVN